MTIENNSGFSHLVMRPWLSFSEPHITLSLLSHMGVRKITLNNDQEKALNELRMEEQVCNLSYLREKFQNWNWIIGVNETWAQRTKTVLKHTVKTELRIQLGDKVLFSKHEALYSMCSRARWERGGGRESGGEGGSERGLNHKAPCKCMVMVSSYDVDHYDFFETGSHVY